MIHFRCAKHFRFYLTKISCVLVLVILFLIRWLVVRKSKKFNVLEQRQFFPNKLRKMFANHRPVLLHIYTCLHTHTFCTVVNYESWLTSRPDILFIIFFYIHSFIHLLLCSMCIDTRALSSFLNNNNNIAMILIRIFKAIRKQEAAVVISHVSFFLAIDFSNNYKFFFHVSYTQIH